MRAGALIGASVLALTSRGDIFVLTALLVAGLGLGLSCLGVVLGALAVAVRFGSASLEAMAGAQAVLGLGATTGSYPEIAACWLAAAAIISSIVGVVAPAGSLSTPVVRRVGMVALGLTAAVAVAGPGRGGAIVVRVLASAGAIVVVALIGRIAVPAGRHRRRRLGRLMRDPVLAAPPLLGAGAVVLAVLGR